MHRFGAIRAPAMIRPACRVARQKTDSRQPQAE
jgi:hypothetical protein